MFTCLVLGRNVGLTKRHQVIYVLSCLEEHPSDCRICHLLIGNHLWAHVHAHKFFHIVHAFVQRQFHASEQRKDHLLAYIVVIMKSPPMRFLPSLGSGLAYIVKKCRPSEEQGFSSPPSRCTSHIVQDLQGMVEIILVGTPVPALHTTQCSDFRQDKFKQSATFQLYESYTRNWR